MERPYPGIPRYTELERPRPAEGGGMAESCRARQLTMLRRLADMAMDLCEDAYLRAKAEPPAGGGPGEAPGVDAAQAADAAEIAETVETAVQADAAPAVRGEGGIDERIAALDGALAGAVSAGAASAGGARARIGGGGLAARPDASLVFERLSRVVYRALALEKQLAEAADAEAEAEDAEAAMIAYEMTPERKAKIMARWQLLLSRKNTIVRVLKAAIAAEHPGEDVEECGRNLNDKLLEFERYEVLNFTIWDNVMRHAQQLRLHPVWEDWAHEPWAVAEKDGELEWDDNPYRGRGP